MARPWQPSCLLFVLLGAASPVAAVEDPEPDAPPTPVVPVGEVAVTATRSERSVLESPGNVTVIDRAAIVESGARDVPELLRREAGIFVVNPTTSPDGYQIDARGFNDGGGNGSSLLVLVNGRRFNDANSSTPDWSLLRVGNIERIEVTRGPASALYGDGAVSGVIHIVTRPAEGPVEVELRGESGTYDTTLAQGFARGRSGPLSGTLYLDRATTDGYRDRADYRAERVEGTLRLEVRESVVLGLDTGFSSDERQRPGAISAAIIDHTDPGCEVDFDCGRRVANPAALDDRLNRRRFHADGLAQVTLSEEVALELRPFYRRVSDGGTITNPPPPGVPDPSTFSQDLVSYSLGLGGKVVVEAPLADLPSRLTVGFDLLGEDVQVDTLFTAGSFSFPTDQDTTRHLYGAYVQEELDLTPELLLSAGLRYDYTRLRGQDELALPGEPSTFRYQDTFWSPKAALVYRLTQNVSTYASYARAFRVPNVDEAFGFFGANEGLDAETSDAFEVGLKGRGVELPLETTLSFDLALYWMDVDDQILFDHEVPTFFDPGAAPPVACLPSTSGPCNVNVDEVRHRGVEVSANLEVRSWLELYGSYTYDDTRITSDSIFRLRGSAGCPDPGQPCLIDLDGHRLPVTPVHRGTAGFWLHLPHDLDVGLNANYVGSRYGVNDLENQFRKLSKYATYDARVVWRPAIGEELELELGLMVRNLLDRQYRAYGGERTFGRGEPFGWNPSPDRTWEVSVALRWGS